MIETVKKCTCDRCGYEEIVDEIFRVPPKWSKIEDKDLCEECSEKYQELKKGFFMGRDFKFTTDAGTARLMRD